MLRVVLTLACVQGLFACSSKTSSSSCPGGQVSVGGACRTVCAADQDCNVADEACQSGICAACSNCRRTPQITSIDGQGTPDSTTGHAANHFRDTLVLRGQDLDGVSVALSGGSFTNQPLVVCGIPSANEIEVLLPSNIAKDTPYTLAIANQAGSCTASVTLLQGEQGIQGPAGSYTIGTGLDLNGSTLSLVFGQSAGTVAAGDHVHTVAPPDGTLAGRAAKSCKTLLADYPSTADGVYWLDPDANGDPFQAYCDMTTDGGGWTLVANIAPNDGNSVGYAEEDFWTKEMSVGTLVNRFSNDFKSPAAYRLVGTHLMIQSAQSGAAGSLLGWRRWPFLGGPRSFDSLFSPGVPAYNSGTPACDSAASDGVSLGTTNSADAMIRQGTCLQADFAVRNVGGGLPDLARLTTVGDPSGDNTMGGFATCIDCGTTWQGVDQPFKGLDHAGCAAATCYYASICRVGTDCLGAYCSGTYPAGSCGAVWNSRFLVR